MSDLISRQAAIDICRAPHMRNADCSDFEMAIMMLPPAQPEPSQLGTNLAEVSTDCISRQAAIDALHTWFRDGFDEDKWWNSTHVLAAIEGLPPAQLDIPDDARDAFMNLVYDELHSDGDNNRANRIIDAADEYVEYSLAKQSAQLGTNLAEVGTDCISRQAIDKFIDGLEEIFADLREQHVDDSVCGLCEYDGAYIGQSGDWCNECPGFDKDDCFKLSDKTRKEWTEEIIKALPPALPKQRTGKCMWCERLKERNLRIEYYWIDEEGCTASFSEPHIVATGIAKFCPNCGAKITEGDAE